MLYTEGIENPKPSTLNPKLLKTLNPKPQNPKPQTLNPEFQGIFEAYFCLEVFLSMKPTGCIARVVPVPLFHMGGSGFRVQGTLNPKP